MRNWCELKKLDLMIFDQTDSLDSVIFLGSGHGSNMSLTHGASTVQQMLGLNILPERVPGRSPNFMREVLTQTNAGKVPLPHQVRVAVGVAFAFEKMSALLKKKDRILDPSVPLADLLDKGDCTVKDIITIEKVRNILVREENALLFDDRADLDGVLHLTFLEYDRHGVPIPGGKRTVVPITGMPGETMTKLKHTWIYSNTSNYGKTTTIRNKLLNVYKAAWCPDSNNAMNLPKNAQFIVCDEVGENNKIPINQLKCLTGGDASASHLNRKSYGASFVPRADAQFVFCGNTSPYAAYATYNKTLGRAVMSEDVLSTLEARFDIYRLDGDNREEKVDKLEVHLLTEDEYHYHLRTTFYAQLSTMCKENLLTAWTIGKSLTNIFKIVKNRKRNMISGQVMARDLQRCLPPIDWPAVKEVIDRFGAGGGSGSFYTFVPNDENYPVVLQGMRTPYEIIAGHPSRTLTPPPPPPHHPRTSFFDPDHFSTSVHVRNSDLAQQGEEAYERRGGPTAGTYTSVEPTLRHSAPRQCTTPAFMDHRHTLSPPRGCKEVTPRRNHSPVRVIEVSGVSSSPHQPLQRAVFPIVHQSPRKHKGSSQPPVIPLKKRLIEEEYARPINPFVNTEAEEWGMYEEEESDDDDALFIDLSPHVY